MLLTGISSVVLISAYGTGGSWMSWAISRWQHGGGAGMPRGMPLRALPQAAAARPSGLDRRGWSRRPADTRQRAVRAPRAEPVGIPAGSLWPAIRVARLDPRSCPGGLLAAANPLADVIGLGALEAGQD